MPALEQRGEQSDSMFRCARYRFERFATSTIMLAALACGGRSVADGTGPDSTHVTPPDTTHGTVQRTSLTVHVNIDTGDAKMANQASVSTTGLTVYLQRNGSNDPRASTVTSSNGTVRFDNLLEGTYTIAIERALTADEIARLAPEDREPIVFTAGGPVEVKPPSPTDKSVSLLASKRGSLVVSEVYIFNSSLSSAGYGFGSYTEVYNNADTVIFLDGVLIAHTWGGMHAAFQNTVPCATANFAQRNDPNTIWVNYIRAFPGTGHDFPIRPGEAMVVAMDAINHAAAAPGTGQVDLSGAQFEEIGSDADVNNPFAKDLLNVTPGTGLLGHGFPATTPNAIVLARPITLTAANLPTVELLAGDGGTVTTYGIPRAAVLDVFGVTSTSALEAATQAYRDGWRECDPWLSPEFERSPAKLADRSLPMAIARKTIGRSATGAEILLRTHNSARDFDYATPLRRSLNK